MNWEDKQQILYSAISKYGVGDQMEMVVEECAELIADIKRFFRHRISKEKLIEEMVDVSIVIDQMKIIYGGPEWDNIEDIKLKKLEKLINEHQSF